MDITVNKKEFQPVTVTLVLSTQVEVDNLVAIMGTTTGTTVTNYYRPILRESPAFVHPVYLKEPAMKTTIELPAPKKRIQVYPVVLKHKDMDIVALFISSYSAVILHAPGGSTHTVGDHTMSFPHPYSTDVWTPCSITLSSLD